MEEKKRGKKEVINSKKDNKEIQKSNFIKWFSELNKNSGNIAGGKGANLAEIFNLKIPVPQGFVVTAQAYDYFLEKAKIKEKINDMLDKINYEDTNILTKITNEIRLIIEKSALPPEIEEEILEAYGTLAAEDLKIKDKPASYILKKPSDYPFVAIRSSATTEDLEKASFAGQQDTFLNVKGNEDLLEKIKKCFSSLYTPRATYYRNKRGFKNSEPRIAVIVQKMIDSIKSGVIFSKDPLMKNDNVIIEAVWGIGEGIVSGEISPDRYIISKDLEILKKEIGNKKIAITREKNGKKKIVKLKEEKSKEQVLKEHEIKKLSEIALTLEDHYKKPQDIEFAIDENKIYIVQTRPITTLEKREEIDSEKELQGDVILTGLAASPGIGVGKIRIIKNLSDLEKIRKGDILVTKMTNPDMVVAMQKSTAIVTDEGGLTAHASIVSREMGIPAVVGTQEATTKLKEGETITVNGFTGKIYKGKVSESIQKEIKPVASEAMNTKTKLKVIIDLPSFAEHASKTKLKSVGLARLEGIIAESGKHPKYFFDKKLMHEYEEIIFKGLMKIAEYFDEIWVRTSDIRSDEFKNLEGSPKELEKNPMLGMHGIRYSLKYPEILKSELKAMKRVSEHGKKIGIMAPQIISLEEVKKLKSFVKELDFQDSKVGIMIETPASVQLIKEFCNEKIDFISFGTNDLTQYTLAVDRGNQQVQELYNELHPAILCQLKYVIKICKENGVETSICGQAGSKKEMVKFLVEQGIDSISVNADLASEIASYILELESEKYNKPEEKINIDKKNSNINISQANEYNQASQIQKKKTIEQISKQKQVPKKIEQEENMVLNESEKLNGENQEKKRDKKFNEENKDPKKTQDVMNKKSQNNSDSKEEILDIF